MKPLAHIDGWNCVYPHCIAKRSEERIIGASESGWTSESIAATSKIPLKQIKQILARAGK